MADDPLVQLYTVSPAEFTQLRGSLAAEAKKRGDAEAARQIAAQRKPSTAAWIVNLLARRHPDTRKRIERLGAQLRDAQASLDADRLRELSAERRAIVDELARQAFAEADVTDPAAALRDDVTGTLQAAIADPDIAERLGRLHRAEHWSGFGDVVAVAPPQLRVVTGGKAAKKAPPKAAASGRATSRGADAPSKQDLVADAKEQLQTAVATVAAAEQAKSDADDELDERQAELAAARMKRDEAKRRLAEAETRLKAAERAFQAARKASAQADDLVKAARRQQRERREALEKARKAR
jgi:chromosome segregation ATPase